MKRYFGFFLAAVAAMLLLGCIGSGGNPAPAPTNVAAKAKDTRVVLTWDMVPGVEYWLFKAAGTGVTPQNCSAMNLCVPLMKVTSPLSVWSLYNGTQYSFSINGRTDGGPGGPGSPAVEATPRLGGAEWSTGSTTVTGSSNLRGVAYGASGTKFVAAGTAGALYSGVVNTSAAGLTEIAWTALTNPMSTTDFYGVNYDTYRGKFFAVGAGGAVIAHTPASSTTWSQLTSKTPSDLYAITSNGAGFNVATGAGGTIITSSDGVAWTVQTSGTANALNAVTYGYDSTNKRYVFVAVGDAGTIRYSTDGVDWTTTTPTPLNTTPNLKSVTYGAAAGVFVAVGTSGAVFTSPDAIIWTAQTATTIPSGTQLNAVTYSAARRFIAVTNDGNIYYNEYANAGVTWAAAAPQAAAVPLHAIATGALFDYATVGASGTNLYAD